MDHLGLGVSEAQCQRHAFFLFRGIPYPAVDNTIGWTHGPYAYNFDQRKKLRRVVCWKGGTLERGGKLLFTVPQSSSRLRALFGKPERVIPAGKGKAVWDYPKLRLAALVVQGKQVTMLELRSPHRQQRLHIP